MKKLKLLLIVILLQGCGEKPLPPQVEKTGTAEEIIVKSACLACHQDGNQMQVPTWGDVAKKYKGNQGAEDFLAGKIPHGGAGSWGTMEMPPFVDLTKAEVRVVVQGILATPVN